MVWKYEKRKHFFCVKVVYIGVEKIINFLRTSFVFNFFLRSAVWCSKTAAWWLPLGGSWKNYSYTWYVTAIFCVLCKALDKFLSGFARVSRTCVLATWLNHSVSGGRGGYAFLLDTQIQMTSLRCVCWGEGGGGRVKRFCVCAISSCLIHIFSLWRC